MSAFSPISDADLFTLLTSHQLIERLDRGTYDLFRLRAPSGAEVIAIQGSNSDACVIK